MASADVMAITKWSISGSENEPRCGRGVDPRATAPALAMLHLTRFQEFKVPSTFSHILFETADEVIPDGHAEAIRLSLIAGPIRWLVGFTSAPLLRFQSGR